MALPPPKRVEMGAFYRVVRPVELSAEFGYTTAGWSRTSDPRINIADLSCPV
jgi:hypothetical protein